MPNAGEREAYIASRVREASKHPKALLLGAIGAICSSPNESANVASDQALGLSIEEIQLARWVALFLKGKTREEFLLGLSEAAKTFEKQGEEAMEVKRGKSFFEIKAAPLTERFARGLFEHGVPFTTTDGMSLEGARKFTKSGDDVRYCVMGWGDQKIPAISAQRLGGGDLNFYAWTIRVRIRSTELPPTDNCGNELVDYSGLRHLLITIADRRAMQDARAFARRWERKSKELKGSREATVTIYQDFV